MLKQLLGNPFVQFLVGRTIGLYMLLVGATTRWRRVNRQAAEPFFAGDGKVVICVWHGRFILVRTLWAVGRGIPKVKMLISRSREGGIVSHATRTVGADVIRGSAAKASKRKGGVEAMRAMARHIEHGGSICMTPDGPSGPRMRAKLAPVQLAKLAGAPLIGVAWSTRNRRMFKSWDRFMLPFPFGSGALVWSDPIAPPSPNADAAEIERVRAKLEQEMNRIAAEADRVAGVEPIEPDALPVLEPAATAS
jgi:lysophospholipid acyltransferase (LPLAT)-like uncharacterized protein